MKRVALAFIVGVAVAAALGLFLRHELLMVAAGLRAPAVCRLAIALGADPNHNRLGRTPLQVAITEGDLCTVDVLIDHGADPNRLATGPFAELPLEHAVARGHTGLARRLLERGAAVPPGSRAFSLAAREGMIPVLERMTAELRASDPQRLQTELDRALFAAIEFAYFELDRQDAVVAWLLGQGARVDQADRGHTPLTWAIEHQVEPIALRLLTAGTTLSPAEIEMTATPTSRTVPQPLAMAIGGRLERLSERLLASGAAVNVCDGWGRTPLHCAVETGNATLTRRLLDLGALVNPRDRDSRTPLDLVGRNATVAALLRAAGGCSGRADAAPHPGLPASAPR